MLNGLPIANAVANINVDSSGQVISGSGSIAGKSLTANLASPKAFKPLKNGPSRGVPKTTQLGRRAQDISATDAVIAAAKTLNLNGGSEKMKLAAAADPKNPETFLVTGAPFQPPGAPVKATLQYYQTPKDGIQKVWSLEIQTAKDWQNVYISTTTAKILGTSSWVSNSLFDSIGFKSAYEKRSNLRSIEKRDTESTAHNGSHKNLARRQAQGVSYNVIPFGKVDIDDNGGSQSVLFNPIDPVASQNGWHDLDNGQGALSATVGNNVVASSNFNDAANPLSNPPVAAANFRFAAPFSENQEPAPNTDTVKAAVTNMFYVTNTFHDVMFHYGFDEAAGNFQLRNFGAGGIGNDPVVATAQDGSGFNNANFATPPDGQAGRMRLFLFDILPGPKRDGAMENDIIIHELAHGLSNRLTGGPANANCLQSNEAGGMGEGWSDFFGVAMQMKASDTRNTDKAVGVFVTGSPTGVRGFAYSTSLTRNPHTYASLQQTDLTDVHTVGEIWNAMLYEVYWNFVDKLGFAPVENLIAEVNSNRGNVAMIRTIVEAMKLQPCNPTFIQARNAILDADLVLFNGANKCEIWKGFAKRGLGFSAVDDETFVDAFDVDPTC
ncbi:Fungalysin metallopeptidase-domain-containing protein [Chytridium lagenaria]|nr:Fungalysin metallopeptidase-domain-containing protein [Chytridium lagenaria]